ncbi:MAG: 50S ribosomal protein L30e [Candidatus Bathyarchaeota archaeon]|nr:50S ribosomal protein L30e [Candidatus Bathyarchaeota archaeon]
MDKFSKSEVDRSISIAVKTGKILFGSNSTIKSVMTGRAKLVIVASNCPEDRREKIEYYCKLSGVPLIIYLGTSLDLGSVCGKSFMVSALTIRDPGDSDILKFAGGENV